MPIHGHGGGNQGATVRRARHMNRGTNLLQRVINFSSRQIGDPYKWGATGPNAWDCSGIVYAAYNHAGYHGIARTTYGQILQGHAVGQAQLRPGDIVFSSPHHEGLYVGNGLVLSAPHTGASVHTLPLAQFGFYAARRLINGGGGVIPPRALGGVSQSGLPVPHPSVNPQMYQRWVQQMNQAQTHAMHQFQQQQAHFMKQFQQQQTQQAAQTRQANLSNQIQQQAADRIAGGAAAQRGLTGGGLTPTSGNPVYDLAAQSLSKTEDVRQRALKQAGIG